MTKGKDTLSILWCDNGLTDGAFTHGLISTVIDAPKVGIPTPYVGRIVGNQIGRQRQVAFDAWATQFKTDWVLFIDSDIVLTTEVLRLLWTTADKINRPVVSGVYFVSKQTDGTLSLPMPALFLEGENEFSIQHVHPLPKNKIIDVDCAGLGLVLLHKSVIIKLKEKYPNESMFAEQEGLGDQYVSEDIVFFRKLKGAGIKVVAHTGAIVSHMKRFAMNSDYYEMYWSAEKEKNNE